MTAGSWDQIARPAADAEGYVWELFHENSKVSRYGRHVPDDRVVARMARTAEDLDYQGHPVIELPEPMTELDGSLAGAIVGRVTPAALEPVQLSLAQLATLLYAGCGVTRTNEGTGFLRPFRTAPSGGGLYPLELYLSTKHVEGMRAGLYHYSPARHHLRRLRRGDLSQEMAGVFVEFQRHLALDASVVVMITALFERSTFKYGARGYRFVLIEAGHVAQNMNLAAVGMGLGCMNIGGFYDRAADELLGLDGLSHSTIYLLALGRAASVHAEPSVRGAGRPEAG